MDKLELNKIYLGDCCDVLKNSPSCFIDLVVTSPPYDNLRTYNDTLNWSFEVFQSVAKELVRVLKDGGVIVWVVADATVDGSETGTSFRQALYFKELGLNLHDTMIWSKPHIFNFGSNLCYKQSFEYMFVLSKGRPKSINLIEDIKSTRGGTKMLGACKKPDGSRVFASSKFICKEYKKRCNVWSIDVSYDTKGHPAVFPVELVADHIRSWSNIGDIVLDPFCGSGTTCVAAYELNRKFIGIEKVKEYFDIADERLKTVLMKKRLF